MKNPSSKAIVAPKASEDGVDLHVEVLGAEHSCTLVMLHGWGRSLESLRGLAELLSTHLRVVMIDLPGFGRSKLPKAASNDGGGWGTLDYAGAVQQSLDSLSITQCILLGHSFGGRISIRLASKDRERFPAVVLIGTHGLQRKRSMSFRLRSSAIRASGKALKSIDGILGSRLFTKVFVPRFGSIDYQQAGLLRKTLVKTVTEDLTYQAQSITQPTLLLWGANDQQTPLDLAYRFEKLITNSELHIFPNAGHEPFSDVGSHVLTRYIERFLLDKGMLS
jgi:pimeloyl-ACP methyl ester carboxylesterase